MKRWMFLFGTFIPVGVVCMWALGPMTLRTGAVVIVAIALGYVWGITAPKHMYHPIGE